MIRHTYNSNIAGIEGRGQRQEDQVSWVSLGGRGTHPFLKKEKLEMVPRKKVYMHIHIYVCIYLLCKGKMITWDTISHQDLGD